MTADNIQYHATFIDSSVSIQGRLITIGPGSINEKLLEVPIGHIEPHASIIITVGLNTTIPNTPNVDSDFTIGVTDKTSKNMWGILDKNNYDSYSPCYIWPASGIHDDTRVSTSTLVPTTTKLTFTPFYKYGSCETAQQGGYINTGRFNAQVDITKPLFLQMDRKDAAEEYSFFYILVETVQN